MIAVDHVRKHHLTRPSSALVVVGFAVAVAGLLHPVAAPAAEGRQARTHLSAPAEDANLLANPSFDQGSPAGPEGWTAVILAGGEAAVAHAWSNNSFTGLASASIAATGFGVGLWQQRVPVTPAVVYFLTGYVAFYQVESPGSCRLQVVWRTETDEIISFVDLPDHQGSRDFGLDFPYPLKFRAPDGAVTAEVNCYLEAPGQAWFDDLFFGPAPVGAVAGTVTARGMPVEGVRVAIWGDPWGRATETFTDSEGRYSIADLPEALPRYVLLASKAGFKTLPAGGLAVIPGQTIEVDFDLEPGVDPADDLVVTYGALAYSRAEEIFDPPTGPAIPEDPEEYSPEVRPYLAADQYITSDDPVVIALAHQIISSLPEWDRNDTYEVAWAVYEWVVRNIAHDAVFGSPDTPYRDVTSGIWQTIQGEGWAWGRSFYDWAYRPAETLAAGSVICVEHSWLAAALLRALDIPARARVGSAEFWMQVRDGYGFWVGLSTSGGSNSFRVNGLLGPGFGGIPSPVFFSVTSEPLLHEDWSMERPGLWRERHPWTETYEPDNPGRQQAISDLGQLELTGEAKRGQGLVPSQNRYQIVYSSITLNLLNVGEQRILDVRFPIPMTSDVHQNEDIQAYWTNHPEAVLRTWVETITNPPVPETQMWFHIEFELTGLVGGPPPPRTPSGRSD